MRNQFIVAFIVTSIGLASAAAQGADMASKMAIKAPPPRSCAQAVDGVNGKLIGTAAGHLFWRDPARGLIGAYGDFTDWDRFGGVHAGHVGGFGGEFANKSYYVGEGAIAVPLGCEWGAQLDLSGGSFDGRFIRTGR